MYILEVENLTKRYGSRLALQGLTMRVPQGSVFGLLGPNGGGKTTTLGIALGVLRATSGTVRWFEQPPTAASRRRIGTLLETPNFYPYLTARQNLRQTAAIKRVAPAAIDAALAATGLAERQHDRFQGFSLGMKQRLALAAALLGQPEVLVLDEPTNGLDPQGIVEIRELIRSLAARGTTILIASHLLDEIEKVCTHVAILSRGQLRASGLVADLLAPASRTVLRPAAATSGQQVLTALAALPWVSAVRSDSDGSISFHLAPGHDTGQLNEQLFRHGIVAAELHTVRQTLETEFLSLVAD